MRTERQDVRVPLYKILLCVRQMDQAFNKEMVNATLRGVKDQTLVRLDLHRLASYGSLPRYGQNQIDYLIDLLCDKGALRQTSGRYKALKLGPPATALLRKERAVIADLPLKAR